jgi:hypothetical protein
MRIIRFEEIGNTVLIDKKTFYSILVLLKPRMHLEIIKHTGLKPKI